MLTCPKCKAISFERGFANLKRLFNGQLLNIQFVPALVCMLCYDGYCLQIDENAMLTHFVECLAKKFVRIDIVTDWYSLLEEFAT